MSGYEELVAQADQHQRRRDFKEASIAYGRALTVGGDRDSYCRQMRGACSRRVAEQRLQKAAEDPSTRQQFLDQAARWLAKAEAYLESSLEDAPPEQRGHIRLEQARNEETIAQFLRMYGADPHRRLSVAEHYRAEAESLLA